jgi:hypothetical protein
MFLMQASWQIDEIVQKFPPVSLQYEAELLPGLLMLVLLTIGMSKPILSSHTNLCTFKIGSP